MNNDIEPQKAGNELVRRIAEQKYEFGFTTDVPTEIIDKGLNEDVVKALPMPRSEKAMSITVNELPSRGMNSDTTVTMSDSNTVFLRPILFISIPVGTLKIRNQKNTNEGKMLATESVRPKSSFT